ncbi:MAG: tRNA (adenosine(37)-N6)-dimethylallyltransferase MiaA [Planctomycetes bacterium]|nr:tRNA (adenosine(37)-N6)-dimethylallyltransferase MiaA [Planctomycetota bacterium]
MNRTQVFAIVGPTGSGKARLARAVAEALGAQLVSTDSMKVYRRMDAGTAKPAMAERAHWRGLDLVEPWERFNAQRFVALFEEVRVEFPARPLLLSGGTMLYLKAATEGLGEAAPRDEALRAALEIEAEAGADLHARLAGVDPETASRVHRNDLRRVIRALEVHTLTGRTQSSFHGQFGGVRPDLDRRVAVVTRTREDMDARIDRRVERMFAAGWDEECEALAAEPRGLSKEAAQAIGYRRILDWLVAGRPGGEAALIEKIQTETRRFARRQLTWLRRLASESEASEIDPMPVHNLPVHNLEVDEGEDTLDHLDSLLQLWKPVAS